MKFLIGAFVIYFILAPIFGFGFMPKWWDNPHGHFLNFDQTRIFKSESHVKPDLRRIKENLYMPFETNFHGVKYQGLITVKPDSGGLPKVGGAVFRDNETDKLGILEGEVVDQKAHYQINFKSKNASQLFNSKTRYQSATVFPTHLEIRSYGEKNVPYIVGPESPNPKNYVKFLPYQVDIEKTYIGKWEASSFEGSWSFEFNPLPGSQLTGAAYFGFGNKKCAYPMFGFPVGRDRFLFMTGESTIDSANCETRSWISHWEEGPIVQFEPFHGEGLRLTLKRQ